MNTVENLNVAMARVVPAGYERARHRSSTNAFYNGRDRDTLRCLDDHYGKNQVYSWSTDIASLDNRLVR